MPTSQEAQLGIRIPAALMERLEREVKRQKTSKRQIVIQALEAALASK